MTSRTGDHGGLPHLDLGHLQSSAPGIAQLPNAERVQRIRADRWIGYTRAVEALGRLEAPTGGPMGAVTSSTSDDGGCRRRNFSMIDPGS